MIKQDIIPKNSKNQKHGLCLVYDFNGNKLWAKGYWINDIHYGYWIKNWINGKLEITLYIK